MSTRAVLGRLAQIAVLVVALSFALFGVLGLLPGDPVDLLILSNPSIRSEDVLALREQRGLDRPWPVQWWRWLAGHAEPRSPPRAPVPPPAVVELTADGTIDAELFVPLDPATALEVRAPPGISTRRNASGVFFVVTLAHAGVHPLPFAVRDAHGLEDAGVLTVYVAPFLGSVHGNSAHEDRRDDRPAERQLAGSTESTPPNGAITDADRMRHAREAGTISGVVRASTFAKGTSVTVDAAMFCPQLACAVTMDDAPFPSPGRTVRFGTASRDDRAWPVALVVDHGALADPARYHRGAAFALLGDAEALGYSQTYKRPVWELLFGPSLDGDVAVGASRLARSIQTFGRVQNTLSLMAPALLLAALASLVLGTWAASRPGGALDRTVGALGILGVSMPPFWIGIMAIVFVAGNLRLLPAGGAQTPGLAPVLADVLADRVRHGVMPVLVLASVYTASWVRTVRAGVIEVMPHPLVRTARAKGASRARVMLHALRNGALPFVTVVALSVPAVFSGALLTETVFAWPGVGRLQYEAILNNDSYVAILVFLVSATLVMVGSLAADVLVAVLDPRVRRSGK